MGSTGSIGQQSLDVVRQHPDRFIVDILAANNCSELLIKQAKEFKPKVVAIANEKHYTELKDALNGLGIETVAGDKALAETCTRQETDMVVAAIVGFAGLRPVVEGIKAGKHIALANKETLVVAGEWVMQKAKTLNVDIIPVDSEHSAIFQCLEGEKLNPVEKIILTGSGGPFRGMSAEKLKNISPSEALRHPTWSMGPKITVDSASLMNKGLEVIEAKFLFNLDPSQIEVIIHPQSIIHSLVQFTDGSMKAQMGLPDMRLPIQYALSYPQRLSSSFPRFDFAHFPSLTFEKPNMSTFQSLALAYQALRKGGNMPCILNAANEMAVHAFLNHNLPFLHIPRIIEQCMEKIPFVPSPSLSELFETDHLTREFVNSILKT